MSAVLEKLRKAISTVQKDHDSTSRTFQSKVASGRPLNPLEADWMATKASMPSERAALERFIINGGSDTLWKTFRATSDGQLLEKVLAQARQIDNHEALMVSDGSDTETEVEIQAITPSTPSVPPSQPSSRSLLPTTSTTSSTTSTQNDSGSSPKPRGPHKKRAKSNPPLRLKIQLLDHMRETKKSQTAAARHFALQYPKYTFTQSQVSNWKRDEAVLRRRVEADPSAANLARVGSTKFPEVRESLEIWISQVVRDGILRLNAEILRARWTKYADMARVPLGDRLQLSNGWVEHIMKRLSLRKQTFHGEAGSALDEVVEEERQRLREKLQGWRPEDVYNEDETGLFWKWIPTSGLSNRAHAGVKNSKERVTWMFATNATGTDKRPPLIIGKSNRPRAFRGRSGFELGFKWRYNKTAWMTTAIYTEWIAQWDADIAREVARTGRPRRILLLHDNFSGHKVDESTLRHIEVFKFAPNLTSHVQPLDAGIIQAWKCRVRSLAAQRAVDRYDLNVPAREIWNINVLESIRMGLQAWDDISTVTVARCWRHTKILPVEQLTAPSVTVGSLLSSATDEDVVRGRLEDDIRRLQALGAVANDVSIDSFISPEEERYPIKLNEEEIFDLVTRGEDTAGDDDDDGDDGLELERPLPPPVTRPKLLESLATVTAWLEQNPWDKGIALERLMGQLTRETRLQEVSNLSQPSITSFFSKS